MFFLPPHVLQHPITRILRSFPELIAVVERRNIGFNRPNNLIRL